MPKSLLNEIAPVVADFVSERRMHVVMERQDQASFGNALVVAASADFDLRIVRDRGQVALDVSPSGQEEWHRLENVLAFISKEPSPADLPTLVRNLSENFGKVAALMTSDLSEVRFTEFEKQRSVSFLQKLFPPT